MHRLRLPRTCLLVATASLLLLAPGTASAIRYAAPGGTGAEPCANPADPCSLYQAAHRDAPGSQLQFADVVELAPGTYSEAAGELGPNDFILLEGATVRGAPGGPRPVVRLESNDGTRGAFYVTGTGAALSDVEIVNEGGGNSALDIDGGGQATRIVARSTTSSNNITCTITKGVLRDSVCVNSAGGTALGANVATFAATHTVSLRNVTAIGQGAGSVGIGFTYFNAAVIAEIEAKSVLAKGESKDVIARGMSGASTEITLDHSRYLTVELANSGGGSAAITPAGTNGNIVAQPLLGADGYTQLADSPTVDAGAVDVLSGTSDIDGHARVIGAAPDIGADELRNPTATAVSCSSGSASAPQSCTATVADSGLSPTVPTGPVLFATASGPLGSCQLVATAAAAASCELTPASALPAGEHTVSAAYAGDASHAASSGSGQLVVQAPPSQPQTQAPVATSPGKPDTRLLSKPARRTTKRMARFAFASDPAGARFECKLDGGSFKACSSPFKRRLKPGRHVFRVRAVADGGVDPSPAVFRWRIVAR